MLRMLLRFPKGIFDGAHQEKQRSPQRGISPCRVRAISNSRKHSGHRLKTTCHAGGFSFRAVPPDKLKPKT